MPNLDVTTWYLEFAGELPPLPDWPTDVQLVESVTPNPEWSQFLFCAVGRRFGWYSRLGWDYGQWLAFLRGGDVRTWALWHGGSPAGYIELVRHAAQSDEISWFEQGQASVEVKFLGLLPAFCGQGLGPALVRAAVRLAREWASGPIWLHTCDADHPAALGLYEREGFVVKKTSYAVEDIPDAGDPRQLCAPFVTSSIAFHAGK
jgi:GNAT superfamily N-acetyltransferase